MNWIASIENTNLKQENPVMYHIVCFLLDGVIIRPSVVLLKKKSTMEEEMGPRKRKEGIKRNL